jgi:CO dehydrogenase maturation factor
MSITIALAGKGGVGKTTVAALTIKFLAERRDGAVLAIDADPSSNLNMALGLGLDWTVGDIREDMLAEVKASLTSGGAAMGGLPGGVSKREYLDYEIRSSVEEGTHFDLIAMGRPEGPGCYCAVNHNLREVIDTIGDAYRYVVIDNEAGMEHLSRRTTRNVDHLFIVSDATQRGIVAAERIGSLRTELDIEVDNAYVIVNRAPGQLPEPLRARLDAMDVPLLGTIPEVPEIGEFDVAGKPLIELPEDSEACRAVFGMLEGIL